jgi:hypothetical protein
MQYNRVDNERNHGKSYGLHLFCTCMRTYGTPVTHAFEHLATIQYRRRTEPWEKEREREGLQEKQPRPTDLPTDRPVGQEELSFASLLQCDRSDLLLEATNQLWG